MKAKIMDESHLLIILTSQEALILGLNSVNTGMLTSLSKITLAKVFLEGCKYTGFSYKNAENITIRTLCVRDGTVVLLFSIQPPSLSHRRLSVKRKKYHIKETTGPLIYQFESCTDMMNATEQLYRSGLTCPETKLVRLGDQYRMIIRFRRKTYKQARALLEEYGVLKGKGRVAAAATIEHGILLAEDLFSVMWGKKSSADRR